MSYDLPFLTSAQRRAAELDPWGITVPQAPQPSNVAFEEWLRRQQEAIQPIISTQPAAAAPDMGMPQIGAEGVIRHRGLRGLPQEPPPQEPTDSFLAAPETFTPLGRMEAVERFGVRGDAARYREAGDLSPEMERGLVSAGLMEPAAPKVKVNEYEWLADKNRWAAPPMDEITDPGYEEFVSGQWVPYPVIDREGTTSQQMVPVKLAQELARRTGLGDQPDRPVADVFEGVGFVIRPLEVFS